MKIAFAVYYSAPETVIKLRNSNAVYVNIAEVGGNFASKFLQISLGSHDDNTRRRRRIAKIVNQCWHKIEERGGGSLCGQK
jgi:hypothetical protein